MTSFKRPVESSEPRRRTPTQAESRIHGAAEWGDLTAMSEAGSRRDVGSLPVAYAVPAPVAEMHGLPQPSAPSPGSGSYASQSSSNREAEARTVYDESALGTQMSSPGEYSLYSRGFSTYEESEQGVKAANGGGGAAGGEGEGRFADKRDWALQQRSSNSWISKTETAEDPWAGSGRQDDDDDGYGGGGAAAAGRGKAGAAAVGRGDPNAPMHDLPPYPAGQQQASQRSIMSHDLTGFSDFDPKPEFSRYESSDGDGDGGISAPHAAASADHYGAGGEAKRAGLLGAAAAAEAADANNKAAKSAKLEKKRAQQQKLEEEAALRAQGMEPRLPEGSGRHGRSGGGGKAGRDRGETKEETEGGSSSGMSEFRISTMEAANTYGDPYSERRRAEAEGGEYALPSYHGLFFTPLMFFICAILLCWEFSLSDWEAVSLSENPSYGPSVETLIEAGAKRTDLIVDEGDWWRLLSPMFLHAGVVHFLFNMIAVLQVGAIVERVFGWWRVGAIYLSAGLFGTIVSAIFVPTQVMVGASGAIFGLLGALWADLWQNWSVNQDKCRMLTALAVVTVVQIVLGMMPYLDNFAHIGGLIMGFFAGLGLLVQKREDGAGEALDKKCYQTTLQLVSAVAVPTLMILGFSLLYGRSDPSEWCSWCENISCVEFPPGDNPWWACDDCSTQGFSANKFDNGTISIECPDSITRYSNECSADTDDLLIDCCIGLCL